MVSDLASYRRGKRLDELADLLRSDPSVIRPTEGDDMTDKPVTVRYTADDLARADALIPALKAAMKADPMLAAAAGKVSRSYVLRLASLRGLAALESEHKAGELAD